VYASACVCISRRDPRTDTSGDSESFKNRCGGLAVLEDYDTAAISINRCAHPYSGLISSGFGLHSDGLASKCDRLGNNVFAGCNQYRVTIHSPIYPRLNSVKTIAWSRANNNRGSLCQSGHRRQKYRYCQADSQICFMSHFILSFPPDVQTRMAELLHVNNCFRRDFVPVYQKKFQVLYVNYSVTKRRRSNIN